MLDLRKVNHVIEIARQGGFAKAAATLNITQSALTRSVQILEDNLGIQVFERGPRGIRLTREGEQFIEGGTKLLEEAATLERFARSARTTDRGRVRMGAAPASFRLFWFEVLPIFAARYPGIEVSTSAESVEEISALLQSGDLDFAIGSLEALRGNGALQIEDIASLAVSPFVRRGHPLDRPEPPSFEDLLAYPMVGPSHADPHTTFINSIASASNSPYRIPHLTVDSFALSLRIVERTDSFSFAFSRYAAAPEFDETFRVWHDWSPVPPMLFHIATRVGWNETTAAKPLIEMLRLRIRRLSDDAPV